MGISAGTGAVITPSVPREFVFAERQSRRGTRLSEVLSVSESIKERCSEATCAHLFTNFISIISTLSGI